MRHLTKLLFAVIIFEFSRAARPSYHRLFDDLANDERSALFPGLNFVAALARERVKNEERLNSDPPLPEVFPCPCGEKPPKPTAGNDVNTPSRRVKRCTEGPVERIWIEDEEKEPTIPKPIHPSIPTTKSEEIRTKRQVCHTMYKCNYYKEEQSQEISPKFARIKRRVFLGGGEREESNNVLNCYCNEYSCGMRIETKEEIKHEIIRMTPEMLRDTVER